MKSSRHAVGHRPYRIFIAALLVCAVFGGTTITHALDYKLNQAIIDPNAPVDVCPNIGGIQLTLPDGMQLDDAGDCYTPTPILPPTPPVSIDLCSNIDGPQTALPNGYYRTSSGLCYLQPTRPSEPIDVCLNLEDIQVAIPNTHYLAADNLCYEFPQPIDVCANIDGPQSTIPTGMSVKDSVCFSPDTTAPISPPETAPSDSNTTPSWVRVMPLYVTGIVGLIILAILIRSLIEMGRIRRYIILLKRRRSIATQIDLFIVLVLDRVRTIHTAMRATIEPGSDAREGSLRTLVAQLESLDESITALEKQQQEVAASPDPQIRTQAVWRSKFFWAVTISSLTLTLLATFFFADIGREPDSTILYFVLQGVSIVLLYCALHMLYTKRALRIQQQSFITAEETQDTMRHEFIQQIASVLEHTLHTLKEVQSDAVGPSFNEFEARLAEYSDIRNKLLLVDTVRLGIPHTHTTLSIYECVDSSLLNHHHAITEKHLTITNSVEPSLTVEQDEQLFSYVIDSLIGNMSDCTAMNGAISIAAEVDQATLQIQVSGATTDIDTTKVDRLVRLLSHATPITHADYSGPGLSILLDRIVIEHLGYSLYAQPSKTSDTDITVILSLVQNGV